MSPVSLSLRLYCRLSPYFLSDLIVNRVSEITQNCGACALTRAEILIASVLSYFLFAHLVNIPPPLPPLKKLRDAGNSPAKKLSRVLQNAKKLDRNGGFT